MDQTIAQIIAASGNRFDNNDQDFDILLEALDTTGLLQALDDDNSDLTVFTPTDEAFVRFARKLGYTGRDETEAFDFLAANQAEFGGLSNLLQYHVSEGRKSLRQLRDAGTIDTLLGETIGIRGNNLDDKEPDLANPKFLEGVQETRASNGRVYAIGGVLIPLDIPGNEKNPPPVETITDVVEGSGGNFDADSADYDILLAALNATGLDDVLDDPNADVTVFAPNDRAFVNFAKGLGFQGNSEQGAFNAIVDTFSDLGNGDPVPELTELLQYHVSAGEKTVKNLRDAGTVETLLADETFEVQGSQLIDNQPGVANPKLVAGQLNIKAANGRVHGISRVLLPSEIGGDDTNLLRGTVKIDRIVGTPQNDLIFGLQANDILLGRAGDDTLRGGGGDDKLRGGRGLNELEGGAGNDSLYGGVDSELLAGGFGDDFILAGNGDDTISGGAGDDFIIGPVGDTANAIIDGGLGKDEIVVFSGNNTVVLRQGDGVDSLIGFEAGQTTFGLANGLAFSDLTIRQRGALTQISVGNERLMTVFGATAAEVNQASNFNAI